MNDTDRLLDASNVETERLLLRAGRAGAPLRARKKALVAATSVLAASTLAAGSAAAGNAALGAKAGSLAALGSLKWLAIVGVIGAGAAASAIVVRHVASPSTSLDVGAKSTPARATSARAPAPLRPALAPPLHAEPEPMPTPEPMPPESMPTPEPTPTASPAPVSKRESSAPSATARAPSSTFSVADELGALDGARGAIDRGEPAGALSILEGYRARFPNGSMRPEATILRIEALEKAGDHAAAVRTADAFLTSDPSTPYAARVRSLVGGRIEDRHPEPGPLTPEPRWSP